ncbi:hypothetical protein [Shewanella dokdonensis]|uniref:Uncharacterized protein n=1 Tax=Shewanella dokdonensis TaxID=712036 RepID=A0ABX8DHF9_9GAMM|nr:hypothetical protein [Shewanella dokdonensis]MCL1075782.1 hypothetical protein [Shewanella dokdonensis]QVK24130.1 hypothetical protein KHX94_05945 [Shewanella dokdonensis]
MSISEAVSQQWQKAELAELIQKRLCSVPEVQQLLVGATSLQTVCNLAVTLAFTEQLWTKDDWDDNQLVGVFFCAFRLLFVKATQQQLTQAEDLIISFSRRLATWLAGDSLDALAYKQVTLMQHSAAQLNESRRQQRHANRNMR